MRFQGGLRALHSPSGKLWYLGANTAVIPLSGDPILADLGPDLIAQNTAQDLTMFHFEI